MGKLIIVVNFLGDVNGDGYEDFGLIGIDEVNENFYGYVIFGKNNLVFNFFFNLVIFNGSNGFKLIFLSIFSIFE